jgi:uncharacterized protein
LYGPSALPHTPPAPSPPPSPPPPPPPPPHREGHLALIKRWHDEGRISIAGGVGDPPHAGLIVLREDDLDAAQAAAEEFVAEDPYQPAGLVTSWRVEPFLNVTA